MHDIVVALCASHDSHPDPPSSLIMYQPEQPLCRRRCGTSAPRPAASMCHCWWPAAWQSREWPSRALRCSLAACSLAPQRKPHSSWSMTRRCRLRLSSACPWRQAAQLPAPASVRRLPSTPSAAGGTAEIMRSCTLRECICAFTSSASWRGPCMQTLPHSNLVNLADFPRFEACKHP